MTPISHWDRQRARTAERRAARKAKGLTPRPLSQFERRILHELAMAPYQPTGEAGWTDEGALGYDVERGTRTVWTRFFAAIGRLHRWGLVESWKVTTPGPHDAERWRLTAKGKAAAARRKPRGRIA